MKIKIIAAMDENRTTGLNGKLPEWKVPGDLKRFKELTKGHVVVMGRKTWESLGSPLPDRTNVVLSSSMVDPNIAGVIVARNFKSLTTLLEEISFSTGRIVWVIGGTEIWKLFLSRADQMYLTKIKGTFQGDTFFPEFEEKEWVMESDTPPERGDHSYIIYSRIKPVN